MKTIGKVILILAATLATYVAHAQDIGGKDPASQAASYRDQYARLTAKVGTSGVGVETLLDKWERVDSSDVDMLKARFAYYFDKGRSLKIVQRQENKYLGQKPVLSLKDSTGAPVNYFQVPEHNDDFFSLAMQTIDKAIQYHPEDLSLYFNKSAALLDYEVDSPDLTLACLLSLVDKWNHSNYHWTYPDVEKVDDNVFLDAVQEYCGEFYNIGSPSSLEAFRTLNEKVLSYWPDKSQFQDNMGAYLQVKGEWKAALKIYDKVLKKNPSDYVAIKNACIIATRQNNAKLLKKYLPMLEKYGTDMEKVQAAGRLSALGVKSKK